MVMVRLSLSGVKRGGVTSSLGFRAMLASSSSSRTVVAWLLIQVADTLFPALQLPDWTVTFVSVLLLFGFLHASNDNATVFSSVAIALEAGTLLGAAYMLWTYQRVCIEHYWILESPDHYRPALCVHRQRSE